MWETSASRRRSYIFAGYRKNLLVKFLLMEYISVILWFKKLEMHQDNRSFLILSASITVFLQSGIFLGYFPSIKQFLPEGYLLMLRVSKKIDFTQSVCIFLDLFDVKKSSPFNSKNNRIDFSGSKNHKHRKNELEY